MAKFADYTRYAASYCPNLPNMVFNRAMLSACKEYFTKTQAWTDTVTLDLVEGKTVYEFPEPWECAAIDTVLSVKLDGKSLSRHTSVEHGPKRDKVSAFALINKKEIDFYPEPKQAQTVTIEYSIKPAFDTTELPSEVFDEHFEGLIAGAIWQIKRMPGTDWYDPNASGIHYQEFQAFIDQKRIEMMTGGNNTDLSVNIPNFS